MNIKLFSLFFCLYFTIISTSQVKIGNNPTTVSPSAVLEIETPNKGLILPRVANTAAVLAPVSGMMVYDLSLNCVRSYQNGAWSACHGYAQGNQVISVDGPASGFQGNYAIGIPVNTITHYFKVRLVNNNFSTAYTFPVNASDLLLSGTTGLLVGDVALSANGAPITSVTIPTAESRELYYRIYGTPAIGATLVGVWNKQFLSFTGSKPVIQCPPIENTTPVSFMAEGSIRLLTAIPVGGTWSLVSGGGSINNATYYAPLVTQNSTAILKYSLPENQLCATRTATISFIIQDCPDLILNTSNQNLKEGTTRTLSASLPNGVWSVLLGGGTIANGLYTAPTVTQDTHVILQYTVGADGDCSEKHDEVTFTVIDCPVAQNNTASTDLEEGTQRLMAGIPAGGYWTLVNGTGTINPATGTYTAPMVQQDMQVKLRYTLPSTNSLCATTTSDVEFIVKECPVPVISTNTQDMGEETTKQLSISPAGGYWQISGGGQIVGGIYTAPSVSADTAVTLTYILPANGACSQKSASVSFIVKDCIVPTHSTNLDAMGDSSATYNLKVLEASPAGGTWSIEQGVGSLIGNAYISSDVSSTTQVTLRYTISAFGCNRFVEISFFVVNGVPDKFYRKQVNSATNHNFVYQTVTVNGRVWLNNNLGAEYANEDSPVFNPAQQSTYNFDHNAFGSMFQGGRAADGHELMNYDTSVYGFPLNHVSETIALNPPDEHFIITNGNNWQGGSQEANRWANVYSSNNPCPSGFRVPTISELYSAVNYLSINSSSAAQASPLKIPISGYRRHIDGYPWQDSQTSFLWSSDYITGSPMLKVMMFNSSLVNEEQAPTSEGRPVRCIKD